jgi:hypothetical protein
MPRALKSLSIPTSFNMNRKYEFTGQTKGNLKQIRRLKDGLVGGWIESEKNLSQEGDSFVYDNAGVAGNARVWGNARVYGNAKVVGNAKVFGDARVFGNAKVYGNAAVSGSAWVFGDADVSGKDFKVTKKTTSDFSFMKNLPESVTSITIDGVVFVRKTVWEKL